MPSVKSKTCPMSSGFGMARSGAQVEEMILYTAELKRPESEPRAMKVDAAAALIDQLALGSCRNVRIGNVLRRSARAPPLLPARTVVHRAGCTLLCVASCARAFKQN